jgi:hypothetical protein
MGSAVENYNALNEILLNTKGIFQPNLVTKIDFSTQKAFVKEYRGKIEDAEVHFGVAHQKGYLTPLKHGLEDIIAALKEPRTGNGGVIGIDPGRYVFLTLLVNAALHPNEQQLKKPLGVLQRIISDQFDSYKNKREHMNVKAPLTHTCSPLIGFIGHLPSKVSPLPPLPTTLEVAFLREYLGKSSARDFTAGAIGIPPGYMNYPLLWAVVGHEVGGHYILSSDDRVLPELQKKIYRELLRLYPSEPTNALAPLWRFWTEEAASDVCAILHLGPTAWIGTISWYTALFKLAWGKEGESRLSSKYSPENWHPLPILIPDLICGAIEQLEQLSPSRRARYSAQIEEIAKQHSEWASDVHFGKKQIVPDPADSGNKEKFTDLPETLPLETMRTSARIVGRYLATVRLDSLQGHSLQDLATWTDNDENAAEQVATEMTDLNNLRQIRLEGKAPSPLQLISGGVLAVVRHPDRFGHINELLLERFHDEIVSSPKK